MYENLVQKIDNKHVVNFCNSIKENKISAKDIDFSYSEASVLHYGYYASTYPRYFVPIGSYGPLGAVNGEKKVWYDGLGFSGDKETITNVNSEDRLMNWSVNSQNDVFNQLFEKFAVNDTLTLNINGVVETKTVDE